MKNKNDTNNKYNKSKGTIRTIRAKENHNNSNRDTKSSLSHKKSRNDPFPHPFPGIVSLYHAYYIT